MAEKIKKIQELRFSQMPVIPVRGITLFPKIMLQFDVGRQKSLLALSEAMKDNQKVFLVPQKNIIDENPTYGDLCEVGVVANLRQILKQNEDSVRILVEGEYRAKIDEITKSSPYMKANIIECEEKRISDNLKKEALMRKVRDIFAEYLELPIRISPEVVAATYAIEDPSHFADFIASNIVLPYENEQDLLCELSPLKKLEKLLVYITREIEILKVENDISIKVREQIDDNQKDYYLREQMKVISQQLGEGEDPSSEAETYKKKINALETTPENKEKLLKECDRLSKMPSGSHEANVSRNYLDVCLELPWGKKTKVSINIDRAKRTLDRDHYGLEKVKQRILETLAAKKMSKELKGQIICFVGPPGVGKTSIVKSIAAAIGMKYQRLSLGGIKDESDIRGHRRTYIGAMPGRIIDTVRNAKSANPLILLDEIDKLGNDFRGDPTSALLEVLDPEQNNTFFDHYIDLPFDLSEVMFITTANDPTAIPAPLYDRMDIIDLVGYTEKEKFYIAKKHLIPKQMKKHGLTKKQFRITDKALRELIDGYTKEAGVRNLERNLAALLRKTNSKIVANEAESISVTEKVLEEMLGNRKFRREDAIKTDEIGIVNGLAWTSVGGEIMPIEAVVMDGTGHIELTGSLGDVMKESAKAAISCIRTRSNSLGIDPLFYKNKDIHIHVPEGAVPKDGPSAGITMATAIASALTRRSVKHKIAMTGEITLRGRVIPVGGLKEKTLAAYSNKINTVIIPKGNEPDLSEIDKTVKNNLNFIGADNIDMVLEVALNKPKGRIAKVDSGIKAANLEPPKSKSTIRPMV